MSYLIKKYSNRKLYDMTRRHYTTIGGIGKLVRSGKDVKVVDDATGRDITASMMARVISEKEKGPRKILSGDAVDAFKDIIRGGGESIREFAGKYVKEIPAPLKNLVDEGRKATDRGRKMLKDEMVEIRKDLEGLRKQFVERYVDRAIQALYQHGPTRKEVLALTAKIDGLSAKLDSVQKKKGTAARKRTASHGKKAAA